jgi:peptidoglycan/xylan/chitin deacetylase (PgdA/CDA1 family)
MNFIIAIRRLLYILLGNFDQLVGRRNDLFVLCYHSINNDGWRYGVSLSEFKKQMHYIHRNYQIVSSLELGQYLKGKRKFSRPTAVITFDDGYADILSARQILSELNIRPTAFVIADSKRANKKQLQTNRRLLTTKELKELVKEGWIIGSHSMTHADFNQLSSKSMDEEIINSQKKLSREVGEKVTSIAYPKGKYDAEILDKASCYSLGFSMDDKPLNRNSNHLTIPRIGVDRSHSFAEFKYLSSPSVLLLRGVMKNVLGGLL